MVGIVQVRSILQARVHGGRLNDGQDPLYSRMLDFSGRIKVHPPPSFFPGRDGTDP